MMPASFELRIGLLWKANWGREGQRQTGLPGLQYAAPRQQRNVPGMRAAWSSQITERRMNQKIQKSPANGAPLLSQLAVVDACLITKKQPYLKLKTPSNCCRFQIANDR